MTNYSSEIKMNKIHYKTIRTALKFLVSIAITTIVIFAIGSTLIMRAFAADDAQTQGYNLAKFDFLHNRAYDASCDPNNGDAFCAAYKIGYYAGWNAANALYGNQVPHQWKPYF
jgi:hypothetical protein